MRRLRFVHADDTAARRLDVVLAGEGGRGAAAQLAEDELATELRRHLDGDTDAPQLFELRVPAGVRTAPHAHVEDEIIHVLEGSLVFGRRSFPAGSSVYVPGGTLYGFRAGPEGARFLNFRPRRDVSFISKEELGRARGPER